MNISTKSSGTKTFLITGLEATELVQQQQKQTLLEGMQIFSAHCLPEN